MTLKVVVSRHRHDDVLTAWVVESSDGGCGVKPDCITIPPSHFRLLKHLLLSVLLLVGAILCAAVGLVGVGKWIVVACAAVVAICVIMYTIAVIRQRPRVNITPEGFVFETIFGRVSHQWNDVEGPFSAIKIGLNEAVAYNWTFEYRTRTRRKPRSKISGYDAVVVGIGLPCAAGELVEMLNAHKSRHGGSPSG